MKVINIKDTSDNICSCGSWLDHWKKFSNQSQTSCSVKGCYDKVEVGAHVQKDSYTDKSWYIIPLCQTHNKADGPLDIDDSVVLVSANVDETCGK